MMHFAMVVAMASSLLTGVVRDRTTGQPMPNVEVRIGAHQAKTNASGTYAIKGVRLGKQTVTFSSSDVPSQRFSVLIKGSVVHFNVRVCSMTLDYSCAAPSGASSSG